VAAIATGPPRRNSGLSAPEPIGTDHDLSVFDCGEPALNEWLQQRALLNESRFSRTFVVCEGHQVIAYYCLSAGSVERAAAPGKLRRNAPDAIPVVVIGRLAVSQGYAGRGLGADSLADALRRIANASREIGIAAIMVKAKDEKARRFYLACAEFVEYPAESRTLFLPVETVVSGIE
jgi:GNAT superfamily N-acetyltransferase